MPAEHPGKFVRREVIPADLSVKDAAVKLGVSRPTLSNFLLGKASCSSEMAARLERTFGIKAKRLLDLQATFDASDATVPAATAARSHVSPFLQPTANEIEAWANTLAARSRLSVLLRILVNSTGIGVSKSTFPGNDDSQRAGWDGWVEALSANPWVPDGKSGWEFGVNAEPKKKADDDYAKSVKATAPAIRAVTTFVFVTPRRWVGKEAWAAARIKDGDWRDVRVYDASNLEEWLEQSIPAQAWFANERGLPSDGVWSLDRCWMEWVADCDPVPTESLFKTDVETARLATKTRLAGPPGNPLLVSADSKLEALALLNCVFSPDDDELFAIRDRVIVFTEIGALARLATQTASFIPVVANREVEAELAPFRKALHSIIVYPRNATNAETDITLEPLHQRVFEEALRDMGCDDDAIDRYSHESGRSLTVLRRRLSTLDAIRTPRWASEVNIAERLKPFLFAGSWSAKNDADKIILAMLVGDDCDYDVLENNVADLTALEDSPMWSAGQYRGLVSKIDVLFAINKRLVTTDIRRFIEVARLVLSEDDPRLDLPKDEQWAAGIHGKVREISAALRDGISETLVLLAVYGHELFDVRLGLDVRSEISSLVASLLEPLTKRILEAHSADLPMYAEAAPDRFLKIIEADLEKTESQSIALMEPASTGLFGRCPRTGLLWALENLSWDPEFFVRAVLVLAKLSRVNIDDNWSNKPSASLAAIFRSWMPQTSVPVEGRIAALEMLVQKMPDIAWRICVDQFEPGPGFGMDSHKPRWRSDARGFGAVVSRREMYVFARKAVDLALAWHGHTSKTLGDLIDRLEGLGPEDQDAVWKLVTNWAPSASDAEKASLRNNVRAATLSYRAARRAENGDPGIDRKKAQHAYALLAPSDLLERHFWLFSKQWLEDEYDDDDDSKLTTRERLDRTAVKRENALREVLKTLGIQGVLALADRGETSYLIGALLRKILDDDAEFIAALATIINIGLLSDNPTHRAVVAGGMSAVATPTMVNILDDLFPLIGAADRLSVLLASPFDRTTWDFVEQLNLTTAYWSDVSPQWTHNSPDDLTFSVERLLEQERPRAAFNLLHLDLAKIPPRLLFRLMREVASGGDEPRTYQLERHAIREAFDALNKSGEIDVGEMAGLEFTYIQVFDTDDGSIPNLDAHLEQHPEMFVEAVVFAYRRKDDAADPPQYALDDEGARERRASSAYRMLERLSRIPGHDRHGRIDGAKLKKWVETVRRGCAEFGRTDVGELSLGKLFASAPAADDGIWPCEPVRDVLDEILSDVMTEGLTTALYNARGVQWRGEGGGQEREEAARYRTWVQALQFSHPKLANAITRMVSMYESEAKWHDTDAVVRKRLRY